MATFSIMEHLDLLEQISSSLLPRSVAGPVHTFALEDPEEAFDDRVVIAVCRRTHAAFDAVADKLFSEVIACILCPSIRMMDERSVRLTNINGHSQRPDHEVPAHPLAHGPAHDPAGEEIHHDRQVEPALFC